MSIVAAPERQFVTFSRGEQREQMLSFLRVGLRLMVSPDTGATYTEPEIATATARLSRWYAEADAIDLVLMAGQQRALFFADQVRPDRAGTAFLEGYHLPMWGEQKLPATGGSGACTALATPGTVFIGSTILGDPSATYGTSPAGLRFQVLFNVPTPVNGVAGSDSSNPLILVGVDTGEQTNIDDGTLIVWANPPIGASGPATTLVPFTGGTEQETDRDTARRLMARIRHKPAAGNPSHIRTWGRDSSNAVADAFVYACAFWAGSVLVCVLQKRANVLGPLAKIASPGTLTAAVGYLTPPGSPVVPTPPHVVVTTAQPVSSNLVLSLALPRGQPSGYEDLEPWPGQAGGVPATITAVTNQTHVQVTSLVALPSGVTAPHMMVWDNGISRFERLEVTSVVLSAGNIYNVVLAVPPTKTLAIGDYISPLSQRHELIAETVEAYFDDLGPYELVDLATDLRAHRAFRFPEPQEESPQRAGAAVLGRLQDALGGALADSVLESISATTPGLPSSIIDGPRLLVVGRVSINPL